MNAVFIACMEKILWLYSLAYDGHYPVVCYDERPCFLIGDVLAPIAMREGKVAKEHYAYEKNGSCALLAAIEPLTGKRLAQVHGRRTKKEYTLFMQALADKYPQAKKIRVVQDNLNTHNASSFYEHLPAEQAFALAQRFDFHYTPKAASWLKWIENDPLIEIEFSAISKQCLNRRIATQDALQKQVLALVKERERQAIKINWQFSIESAREKLNSKYEKVNADNKKCKKT
jgi:hypothetical protein